ncbi:MAG: sigma-70 family RNA polymerase sigma factor, partial [Clostridiales Family XIII bacterium]|nr:sigma-70 family RNA polymerase sigma factor [Clostridiales Family XIII bacterium]
TTAKNAAKTVAKKPAKATVEKVVPKAKGKVSTKAAPSTAKKTEVKAPAKKPDAKVATKKTTTGANVKTAAIAKNAAPNAKTKVAKKVTAKAPAKSAVQMNDSARLSMLFDYYGQLLTEKQREVVRLYHEEDLSLSEIAKILGISRQGVHESLKKAKTSLFGYEDRLGLLAKHGEYREVLAAVSIVLGDEKTAKAKKIRKLIGDLDI